ncbi:unnamed protein product [Cuscuta epithymum]|uniref:Steroid nuclear receptor ligand-binding n=1 Tax=Cuscuta epithymum TaxID=186058 RepID=A0AAV0BX98_9ASTE|nr:unnamed protein product [Cuscuta epithymum]
MKAPVEIISKLLSFLFFFPFFFLLFFLGCVKGLVIGTILSGIIGVGNSAVVIGLWPAHFVWTYLCVAKSKRLGCVLKSTVLVLLPLPLILWPIMAILGSLFGGLGYGFFVALVATFKAINEGVTHKIYHCFVDGTVSTIKEGLTIVMDFTDFCFHSYFSYMDELCEEVHLDERLMDVKLSNLPTSLLVSVLAIIVDVPLITAVAIWKSPCVWFRGWKRMLEDLVGREGPFLETACVPFAVLAVLLWPLVVAGFVVASFVSSFFLAMYSGVVVHQEDSSRFGLAYIVAAVSLFDEYTNDLLGLREGSCFIRPRYRRDTSSSSEDELENNSIDHRNEREESRSPSMGSTQPRQAKQKYTPMQVWGWLFKSCEVNGRTLLREGLIAIEDIVDGIVKGNSKNLDVKLPAFSILQCLLESAKSYSVGLVIFDGVELTKTSCPQDIIFEWFVGPLLVMKEQMKILQLGDEEEVCLRKLIMCCQNGRSTESDDIGFLSNDNVRRAQLLAIMRRLQGIGKSISRMPTYRRHFKNLVKQLYHEAKETSLSNIEEVPSSSQGSGSKCRHSREEESEGGNVCVENEQALRINANTV